MFFFLETARNSLAIEWNPHHTPHASSHFLTGTMNNTQFIVICFDYGGCYSMEGDFLRWRSGGDELYTVSMRASMEEVTYLALVGRIGRKMMTDVATTQLKLSYFPLILNVNAPSYIKNDDDVLDYLLQVNQDGCRSLFHVELIKDIDQNHGCVQLTGEVRENEAGLGDGMMTQYTHESLEHYALLERGITV